MVNFSNSCNPLQFVKNKNLYFYEVDDVVYEKKLVHHSLSIGICGTGENDFSSLLKMKIEKIKRETFYNQKDEDTESLNE